MQRSSPARTATTWVLFVGIVGCGQPARATPGQDTFVASVIYRGVVVAAARAGGLYRLEISGPVAIDIGLTPRQQKIVGMAVVGNDIWLGTEAGLLRVAPTSCGYYVGTVLAEPVRMLSIRSGDVRVVTTGGTFRVDARGEVSEGDLVWATAALSRL